MEKRKLKKLLTEATLGCTIQRGGWPCSTCFFSLSDSLTNKDWQTLLLYRGDYKEEDLNNLPKTEKEREESLNKIARICEEVIKKEVYHENEKELNDIKKENKKLVENIKEWLHLQGVPDERVINVALEFYLEDIIKNLGDDKK